MAAIERGLYSHVGRLIGRLENGHNIVPVRQEALRILQRGTLPEGREPLVSLIESVEKGWRKAGEVVDSELDAEKLKKIPQI